MPISSFGIKTDQGPFLKVNEDFYEADIEKNLYMLIDAFGGAGVGDKAAKKVSELIKENYGRISGDVDATLPFYYSPQFNPETNALINSILYVHQIICQDNTDQEMQYRAGVCGTFIAVHDDMASIVNIGNLRSLLISDDQVQCIIAEQDFQYQVPRSAHDGINRIPISAIGLYEELSFQVKEVRLQKNDLIISLTDGVFPYMNDSEVKYMLDQTGRDLGKSIDHLFSLANDRDNHDNQSCLILAFS